MSFYSYLKGRVFGDLGTGANALGLRQPQTLPKYDGWLRPRYQVRDQLAVQAPGFVKENQQFVPVSLIGNGIELQGQFALQALAQLTGDGSQ